MAFPQPPSSKSQVDRAGRRIANGEGSSEDIALVDQWRAAHGYALNTFQAMLRQRVRSNTNIDFVQRLKRRNTVTDKLQRVHPDGTPLIRNVTSMHDFAGCRLIFPDIEQLKTFRASFHDAMSARSVRHKLKNEIDKYDYIANPKVTGYRGIHDVFAHRPRSHRRGDKKNEPWQGLLVEVQYRTRAQNSWATAVEIADLISSERTKFGFAQDERGRFFALASEIIARKYEGQTQAFSDLTIDELVASLNSYEENVGILSRLTALRRYNGGQALGRHSVLNIIKDTNEEFGFSLQIKTFQNGLAALQYTNILENDPDSINAVYVRSDSPNQLRSAYKNYFSDPTDFVSLLRD